MAAKTEVSYHVSKDADALSEKAAEYLIERAAEATKSRGRVRIAVSGGSTPKKTFALLADESQPYRARMPWAQVELYFVDERCVTTMPLLQRLSPASPTLRACHRAVADLDAMEATGV